jgi:hypothetical protein
MVVIGVLVSSGVAGAADPFWLDAPLKNWNQVGMTVPKAPTADADPVLVKRCHQDPRPPASAGDRALVAAGWWLVGPLQLYGDTALLLASADVDGMCRPMKMQGFVFVGDRLAGTLSPDLMDSRADGSVTQWRLYDATTIAAEFARYKDSDPLCCPSAKTGVMYSITGGAKQPLLAPTSSGE